MASQTWDTLSEHRETTLQYLGPSSTPLSERKIEPDAALLKRQSQTKATSHQNNLVVTELTTVCIVEETARSCMQTMVVGRPKP